MRKHLLALISSSTPILPPFPLFFSHGHLSLPGSYGLKPPHRPHFAPHTSTSLHCEMAPVERLESVTKGAEILWNGKRKRAAKQEWPNILADRYEPEDVFARV